MKRIDGKIYFTMIEVAKQLGYTRQWVYKLCEQGAIEYKEFSTGPLNKKKPIYLISEEEVIKYKNYRELKEKFDGQRARAIDDSADSAK